MSIKPKGRPRAADSTHRSLASLANRRRWGSARKSDQIGRREPHVLEAT